MADACQWHASMSTRNELALRKATNWLRQEDAISAHDEQVDVAHEARHQQVVEDPGAGGQLGEKQRSHSCLAFPSGRQALRYFGSLQDGTPRVRPGPGVLSARLPGREAKKNPDRPTTD